MSKKILFGFFIVTVLFAGGFFNTLVLAEKEPECESGPCCDEGNFSSSSTVCDTWYNYKCSEEKCGNSIERQEVKRYCSGDSADCTGEIKEGAWNENYKTCCHLAKCEGPEGFTKNEDDYSCQIDEKCPPRLYSPDGATIPLFTENTASGTISVTFRWEDLTDISAINAECETHLTEPYINSYYLQVFRPDDKKDKPFFPWVITKEKETGILPNYFEVKKGDPDGELFDALLTKYTTYKWRVAGCTDDVCKKDYQGEFSSPFEFTTGDAEIKTPQPKYPKYRPGLPEEITTVNFGIGDPKSKPSCPAGNCYLNWEGDPRAYYYQYEIKKEGQPWESAFSDFTKSSVVYFKNIWQKANLGFDATSTWRVRSCWGEKTWWGAETTVCEDEWSEEWKFKTTGATPTGLSPTEGTTTTIPVLLNWNDVDAALSYRCEIATSSTSFEDTIVVATTTKISEIKIEYPNIKMGTDYWWRVSSCADENGEVCSTSTTPLKFTTLLIPPPQQTYPPDGGELYLPENLKWNAVENAKKYEYTIDSVTGEKIKHGFINAPFCSLLLRVGDLQKEATYRWAVRSCFDETEEGCGKWSSDPKTPECPECQGKIWEFKVAELVPPTQEKGLIPCGRKYDNPQTIGYKEDEPCEFKHIFLMLKLILDFALWRLGVIILAVLSIIIGAMSYFSLGDASTLQQIKSLLKAAAVGWCIILLAWMFINYLLSIFGFNISIFGHWWQLPQ